MKNKILLTLVTGTLMCLTLLASQEINDNSIPAVKRTTIEGQGHLKVENGDIKTCAGEKVFLLSKDDSITLQDISKKMKKVQTTLNCISWKKDKFVDYAVDYQNLLEKYPDLNVTHTGSMTQYHKALLAVKELESDRFKAILDKKLAETVCEINGNFLFNNIPHGEYGIITWIRWEESIPNIDKPGDFKAMTLHDVHAIVQVNEFLQKVNVTDIK
ncbi:hypothetical protein [Sulfuricurvum sp.]|uniref:hypothetical protein n=1 Tax=Sulfuricurvum sp. TaxID=2025608 RepID=UPI00263A30B4|nr:hypothetical protein [Sulfuricurvum sp.]MDD2265725.1 hypothetical protein [Sulfuricurvum sp.]MDD2784797.1 hypothetical protein [Sulfuricurvum sp.]